MSHQSDLIATDINGYLEQHRTKELLRLLTCGSVDDGKSTLIGRLLHDSKLVYEDQLAAVKRDSEKHGTTGSGARLTHWNVRLGGADQSTEWFSRRRAKRALPPSFEASQTLKPPRRPRSNRLASMSFNTLS